MILEKVPKSLRGNLTRFLVEVDTGVFVGRISATVRELLWERAVEKAEGGRVALAYRTNNEQGFALRLHGYPDRFLRDFRWYSVGGRSERRGGAEGRKAVQAS